MFSRSSPEMIPVGGLDLWRIGQRQIFLLIHYRFPPGHLPCSMPRSISIS